MGPYHLRGSDVLPDGQIGVYFGNGETVSVSPAPIFNPDFTVTFSSPPTFGGPSYSGPVSLSQSVPTQLNPAPSYELSFWVSGENADNGSNPTPGIFGLRVGNTVPGDPITYLSVPPGPAATIGKSHVYRFGFTPINTAQPVTVEFLNFGHAGNPFPATEIVLDDVRVTPSDVPPPDIPPIAIAITTSNNIVLSWPSPATNFVLQVNSSIHTTNWTTITNAVIDDSFSKWVILPVDQSNRF